MLSVSISMLSTLSDLLGVLVDPVLKFAFIFLDVQGLSGMSWWGGGQSFLFSGLAWFILDWGEGSSFTAVIRMWFDFPLFALVFCSECGICILLELSILGIGVQIRNLCGFLFMVWVIVMKSFYSIYGFVWQISGVWIFLTVWVFVVKSFYSLCGSVSRISAECSFLMHGYFYPYGYLFWGLFYSICGFVWQISAECIFLNVWVFLSVWVFFVKSFFHFVVLFNSAFFNYMDTFIGLGICCDVFFYSICGFVWEHFFKNCSWKSSQSFGPSCICFSMRAHYLSGWFLSLLLIELVFCTTLA